MQLETFPYARIPSELVPTENYDYDFSTATFLEIETMRLFKLTIATQEDCGASFKQVWRKGRNLHWLTNTYFPGEAPDRGQFVNANALHFEDELTVLADGLEAVGAGQVDHDRPATVQQGLPLATLDGYARVVSDLGAQSGQRVEERGLSGVGTADQSEPECPRCDE